MCSKSSAKSLEWNFSVLHSVCVLVVRWREKGVHRVRSFWKFTVRIAWVSCRGLTNGLRVFISINRIEILLKYEIISYWKNFALVSFLIELMAWRHHNLPLHRLIILLKIHFIHMYSLVSFPINMYILRNVKVKVNVELKRPTLP